MNIIFKPGVKVWSPHYGWGKVEQIELESAKGFGDKPTGEVTVVFDGFIKQAYDLDGRCLAYFGNDAPISLFLEDYSIYDTKRIALCLNACRNLSNIQLEDDAVEKLREDRDLLLKAVGIVYASKWIK